MRFDQDTIKRCHSYIPPAVSGSQYVGILEEMKVVVKNDFGCHQN
jgi:hypothetical protein